MERITPQTLNYDNILPLAIESRSNRREFRPVNGQTFTPAGTNHIRIDVNADSMLDALHSYLSVDITNNGGANTYANATSLSTATFPVTAASGLPNPNGTQNYTIRVYNGANDCFTDTVVTLTEKVCTDYGDLQDTSAGTGTGDYQTLGANAGPSHELIAGLFIGASVDDDLDGQPSVNANGDTDDGFSFSCFLIDGNYLHY